MAGTYDQSHNERPRNIFAAHLMRPFKRMVDVVRNRVNDLTVRMNSPAFLDQYPAKSVPYIFSKLYGPFDLVTARRNGAVGHEGRAQLVNLGAFITPANGNIIVGRDGPFYWCSSNIAGYLSFTQPSVTGFATAGGIFDPVLTSNGGAHLNNFFYGAQPVIPPAVNTELNCSFDVTLYDKKRGSRLHEETLPPQILCAQGMGNKETANPIRFDPNSEIEPRVRILEFRMGSFLDADVDFNDATVTGYLNICFIGYKVLEV